MINTPSHSNNEVRRGAMIQKKIDALLDRRPKDERNVIIMTSGK